MMKLFESLPTGVTVDGKFYPCDFDFRNVLKMLDVMQRDDLYPDARDFLCIRCVCRKKIKNVPNVYRAIGDLLFEKKPDNGGQKLTSFEQDASLIRVAFRQVYHIDLFREKLTWFEFSELLHNLPDGNRYEDVIGIRARPMPAPTKYNAKEREWLMKAKADVALHMTEAEQTRKYDQDVTMVFRGLMSMIPKEEVKQNAE
jgi:hypothetical protein